MGRKKQTPAPTLGDPCDPDANVPADDPAECRRLAKMLPRVSDPKAFCNDLIKLSHWLKAGLCERKVRDTLDDLHGKLESALSALRDLGKDASNALADRACWQPARLGGERGETLWREPELGDAPPSGRSRIAGVDRAVADCTRWAAEARDNLETRGTRPPDQLAGPTR